MTISGNRLDKWGQRMSFSVAGCQPLLGLLLAMYGMSSLIADVEGGCFCLLH